MSEQRIPPALLISSTRTLHIEGCPSMTHVKGGRAVREKHIWNYHQYEHVETTAIDMVGEWTETYRQVEPHVEKVTTSEVDLRITLEELVERGIKYTRCAICCPPVPEWTPTARIHTSQKRAGTLGATDIGRTLFREGGEVQSVHHRAGNVTAVWNGERWIEWHSDEHVEFIKVSERTA